MASQKDKKPQEKPVDYVARAKTMLLDSLGRLPTSLVLLLLISMAMASIAAMVMVFTQPVKKSNEFMPLRLEASAGVPVIDQKELSKALQGTWVYQTMDYAMVLTFIGNRFEWIVSMGDVPDAQFYARGNFRLEGDVMVLGVRPDLGVPYDDQKPWMKYLPIGMKDLNIKFSWLHKDLVWTVPSSEQARVLGDTGRIFVGHENGLFEWVRQ